GDWLFKLDIYRLGVADEDRHTHARRNDLNVGIENLLRLDHHLPFFLGEAGVEEIVDVRNDVERDLLREVLSLDWIGYEDSSCLPEKLVHGIFSGARHRLVRGDDNTLDLSFVVKGLQSDNKLRCGAIGICDDPFAGAPIKYACIDLGHDERHLA